MRNGLVMIDFNFERNLDRAVKQLISIRFVGLDVPLDLLFKNFIVMVI